MTKSELIERLAKYYPHLVMKDAEVAVQTILDVMCNSLMVGDRVEIRGFGVFNIHYRLPRNGRNPKSGEASRFLPSMFLTSRQARNCGNEQHKIRSTSLTETSSRTAMPALN